MLPKISFAQRYVPEKVVLKSLQACILGSFEKNFRTRILHSG